jgi:hypothetical protein
VALLDYLKMLCIGYVNLELERMRNKSVVAYFYVLYQYFPGRTEETTKTFSLERWAKPSECETEQQTPSLERAPFKFAFRLILLPTGE